MPVFPDLILRSLQSSSLDTESQISRSQNPKTTPIQRLEEKLENNAKMASSASIQIVAYIKRNISMSSEQFYDHWQNKHAPIVATWAKKHNALGYIQVSSYSAFI
jgi:hypothetical protein